MPKNKTYSHFENPQDTKGPNPHYFDGIFNGIVFLLGEQNSLVNMKYSIVLTKLYYILIYADGKVNDHELAMGRQIVKTEFLKEEEFRVEMELLKSKQPSIILTECIEGLKKLGRNQQIRIVAWLCVVANGDGYMDKAEWQLIYRIYHTELNLPLGEIFQVQKQLSRIPRENSSSDIIKPAA